MSDLKAYTVWDAPTRWFHWINALTVLVLAGIGFAILQEDALGISTAGLVALKTAHIWTGYVFLVNLMWRIIVLASRSPSPTHDHGASGYRSPGHVFAFDEPVDRSMVADPDHWWT